MLRLPLGLISPLPPERPTSDRSCSSLSASVSICSRKTLRASLSVCKLEVADSAFPRMPPKRATILSASLS
eukprot:scaffold117158_cov32-Tisochrysis_lutea.AAC.3